MLYVKKNLIFYLRTRSLVKINIYLLTKDLPTNRYLLLPTTSLEENTILYL